MSKDLLNDKLRVEIDDLGEEFGNACYDIASSCVEMGEGPMTADDAYNDVDCAEDMLGDRLHDVMTKARLYDNDDAWNQAVRHLCEGTMRHLGKKLERRLWRAKKRV